jgi:hypothetical protein
MRGARWPGTPVPKPSGRWVRTSTGRSHLVCNDVLNAVIDIGLDVIMLVPSIVSDVVHTLAGQEDKVGMCITRLWDAVGTLGNVLTGIIDFCRMFETVTSLIDLAQEGVPECELEKLNDLGSTAYNNAYEHPQTNAKLTHAVRTMSAEDIRAAAQDGSFGEKVAAQVRADLADETDEPDEPEHEPAPTADDADFDGPIMTAPDRTAPDPSATRSRWTRRWT